MPRSDGTVLIDTKIDMSGLNRGTVDIKSQFDRMSNSAKVTADTINGAFSRPLENAKLRVESLERDLEGIQAKLKEALSDDDDVAAARLGAQQERVYDRLEDARRKLEMEVRAAAARQAEAEEKAAQRTEAANMKAAESARTISKETKTSANNMSGMEKSARRFKSRMREIVTGAFFFNIISSSLTRLTQTLWGAISSTDQMKSALSNLQGAAYTAASPLLNVLSNAFTVLANAIATALSYLSQLYSLLSGKSLSVLAGTAEEMGNVANAAGAAGGAADKAKKSLAGFDEITTLAPKDSGGGGGGGVTTPNYDYNLDSGINPQIQALADKIKELIAPLQKIDFSKSKKSLKDLGKSFKDLGKEIGGALEWAWFNILVPLAEWVIEDAAPESVELLTKVVETLTKMLDPLIDGFEILMEAMEPIFTFIGESLIVILEELGNLFERIGDVFVTEGNTIRSIFENVGDVIETVWNIIEPVLEAMRVSFRTVFDFIGTHVAEKIEAVLGVLDGLTGFIAGVFTGDWDRAWEGVKTVFENIFNSISGTVTTVTEFIGMQFSNSVVWVKTAWEGISGWFDKNVATPIKTVFSNAIGGINTKFGEVSAWISEKMTAAKNTVIEAWNGVSGWFETNVVNPIKTAFSTVWDAITGIFTGETQLSGLVDKVGGFFKTLANAIIEGINRALIRANSYVNQAIGKFKNFVIGGVKPFAAIQYSVAPQIPYLAKGAVIPPNAPFMAMLGDQRHGTNIEAPLSTIQEALAIELANQVGGMMAGFEAVIARQERILAAIEGIEIGDSVIGEAVERYNRTMTRARGA